MYLKSCLALLETLFTMGKKRESRGSISKAEEENLFNRDRGSLFEKKRETYESEHRRRKKGVSKGGGTYVYVKKKN